MITRLIVAAWLATGLASMAPMAAAAVMTRMAPPPPRAEAAPEPRRGYVWVQGHWEWRNRHHQWVQGSWLRERRGYHYNQPTWSERNGRWTMDRGQWRRGDRDGDGVPNQRDRAPNNPQRN